MPSARRRTRFAALAGFTAMIAAAVCAPPGTAGAQPIRLDLFEDPPDATPEPELLPVQRVVRFSLRDNELGVSSDLRPGERRRAVRLRGLAGSTHVELGQRPRGRLGLLPYFRLTHVGPATDAGDGFVETTVDLQNGRLKVLHKTQVDDVSISVSLTQDDPSRRNFRGAGFGADFNQPRVVGGFRGGPGIDPAAARPDLVQLSVTRRGGRVPPADEVRLHAASFSELLRDNPGVTARYLAPVFRLFGQDADVFRVDDRMAWQLFPGALEADELTESKVLELVDRLDDDDFRQRELATVEIELLGGPAMMLLGEIDRATLTAEQSTRVEAILARYTPLAPEQVAKLLDDPEFLLRCFTYSDVAPVRAAAVRAMEKKLGKELPLDARHTLPRRANDADVVRDGLVED